MIPWWRRSRAYIPLALTLPLLWGVSEGQAAVKPVLWVAVAIVAAVGIRTAFPGDRAHLLDVVLASLLGIAATHRLLWPGFPSGHDMFRHMWGLYGFYRAIMAGNFFPRWIHHLELGMPLLMFYPPLPFYVMLPFMALKLAVYDALKYGLVLFAVLAGISMFYVVQRWTGDRRAALVAAGAYCFAPYRLLDSTYRAAVGEVAAMAILPLVFFYAHRAIEDPSRQRIGVAAGWMGVLTLTHPLSVSMVGIGTGIWILAGYGSQGWKSVVRSLAVLVALGVWGVGLAGYYTVPVAVEGRYVAIDDSLREGSHSKYYWRGLSPIQLFERREWSELQSSQKRASKSKQDEMPFYFGLSLLALLPLARQPWAPKGLLSMTLCTLALTLYPFDILFADFPPMRVLQFPWRFLAIATFGACALAGVATVRLLENARGRWLERIVPGALFALLVVDFFPYTGAPTWIEPYAGIYLLSEKGIAPNPLPLRVDHLPFPPADSRIDLSRCCRRLYPEYFTSETRKAFDKVPRDQERVMLERAAVGLTFRGGWPEALNPKPYAEFTPVDGGPVRGLEFSRAAEWIRVRLPGEAGTLVVKEQWFPGWAGQLSNEEVEVGKTVDGLMSFDLKAADAGELTLHFSRTRWDRLAGLFLSGVCLSGLWGAICFARGHPESPLGAG